MRNQDFISGVEEQIPPRISLRNQDYNCMLRICCKPMILITSNMAKTCLKVVNVNHYKLMSLYRFKPLHV
jgi:hypothetical protein